MAFTEQQHATEHREELLEAKRLLASASVQTNVVETHRWRGTQVRILGHTIFFWFFKQLCGQNFGLQFFRANCAVSGICRTAARHRAPRRAVGGQAPSSGRECVQGGEQEPQEGQDRDATVLSGNGHVRPLSCHAWYTAQIRQLWSGREAGITML